MTNGRSGAAWCAASARPFCSEIFARVSLSAASGEWNVKPCRDTPMHSPVSTVRRVPASSANRLSPQCARRYALSPRSTRPPAPSSPAVTQPATAKDTARRAHSGGSGIRSRASWPTSSRRVSSYCSSDGGISSGTVTGRYQGARLRARPVCKKVSRQPPYNRSVSSHSELWPQSARICDPAAGGSAPQPTTSSGSKAPVSLRTSMTACISA